MILMPEVAARNEDCGGRRAPPGSGTTTESAGMVAAEHHPLHPTDCIDEFEHLDEDRQQHQKLTSDAEDNTIHRMSRIVREPGRTGRGIWIGPQSSSLWRDQIGDIPASDQITIEGERVSPGGCKQVTSASNLTRNEHQRCLEKASQDFLPGWRASRPHHRPETTTTTAARSASTSNSCPKGGLLGLTSD